MTIDVNDILREAALGEVVQPVRREKDRKRQPSPAQLAALEKARKARWKGHSKQTESNGDTLGSESEAEPSSDEGGALGRKLGNEGAKQILTTLQPTGDNQMANTATSKSPSGMIYKLLPKVTAEIGAIRKEQQNSHQRYRYRGIDDALNQVSPVLAKHGVCTEVQVSKHKVVRHEGNSKAVYQATLLLQIAFIAPDGSRTTSRAAGEGISHADDKATSKAMSAAMKYVLFFGLMIPVERNELVDSDDDSQSGGETINKAVVQAEALIVSATDVEALGKLLERIEKADAFSATESKSICKKINDKIKLLNDAS